MDETTHEAVHETTHWVLTLVCTDRPGIVHSVSGAIVEAGGNISVIALHNRDLVTYARLRPLAETGAIRLGLCDPGSVNLGGGYHECRRCGQGFLLVAPEDE